MHKLWHHSITYGWILNTEFLILSTWKFKRNIVTTVSTLLTFRCEDLAVQLVFLVVLLLSLSSTRLSGGHCGDAHLRQVLCIPLSHPHLSKLLLLLVDVTDAASYHGIDHRRLFGEDLKSLCDFHLALSFFDDRVKLQPQAALEDVPALWRLLKVPGELVIGEVEKNVLQNNKRGKEMNDNKGKGKATCTHR